MAKEPEQIEGVIAKQNDTGLYVNGAWFNFSTLEHKKADTAALRALNPTKGQRVRISYTPGNRGSGGFIEDLQILDASPAPAGHPASNGHPGGNGKTPEDRLSIERQTCLKAAVEFLTPRPEAKSKDVLLVAALFEGWLHRTPEAPAEAGGAR